MNLGSDGMDEDELSGALVHTRRRSRATSTVGRVSSSLNGVGVSVFVSGSNTNSIRQIWPRYRVPARGRSSHSWCWICDWHAGQRHGMGLGHVSVLFPIAVRQVGRSHFLELGIENHFESADGASIKPVRAREARPFRRVENLVGTRGAFPRHRRDGGMVWFVHTHPGGAIRGCT